MSYYDKMSLKREIASGLITPEVALSNIQAGVDREKMTLIFIEAMSELIDTNPDLSLKAFSVLSSLPGTTATDEFQQFLAKLKISHTFQKANSVSFEIFLTACKENNLPMAHLLIEELNGDSLLHIASAQGNLEIVKEAFEKASNLLNSKDFRGLTPLDYAQIYEWKEVEEFLLKKGAEKRPLSMLEVCKNFTFPISPSPSLPIDGIHDPNDLGVRRQIEKFIDAHHEEIKPAIRAMMDSLVYVSFRDFMRQLDKTVDFINASIPNDDEYIMCAMPGKSNEWVSELALPKLSHLPVDIVDNNLINLDNSLNEHPKVKHFVLFDDATYSGKQLYRLINSMIGELNDLNIEDFKIYIAVPYMTPWSKELLNQSQTFGKGEIIFCEHKTFATAFDQMPAEHVAAIEDTYFPTINLKYIFILLSSKTETLNLFSDDMRQYLEEEKFSDLERYNRVRDTLFDLTTEEQRRNPDLKMMDQVIKNPLMKEDVKQLVFSLKSFLEIHSGSAPLVELKAKFMNFMLDIFDDGLHSRTLTIFDHKVSDSFSTAPGLQDGEVYRNGRRVKTSDGQPVTVPMFKQIPPYRTQT